MAWHISGRSLELCSCDMMCPCWLGPEEQPDQGWCAAVFGFDVQQGSSDGVDLSGATVVLMADWPGNFFEGRGKARLYIDKGADDDQQRELEAIFSGRRGGHLEGLWGAVIAEWLPTRATEVDIAWGENPSVTIDSVGQGTLRPLSNGAGQPTRVTGAVTQAGLQIDGMDLANSRGSEWSDPDMHRWAGSSGTLHEFDWRA